MIVFLLCYYLVFFLSSLFLFFFFNDTATTEIYTLSLHDALPIHRLGHHVLWRRHRPVRHRRPAVLEGHRRRTRVGRKGATSSAPSSDAVGGVRPGGVRTCPRRLSLWSGSQLLTGCSILGRAGEQGMRETAYS